MEEALDLSFDRLLMMMMMISVILNKNKFLLALLVNVFPSCCPLSGTEIHGFKIKSENSCRYFKNLLIYSVGPAAQSV